MSTQRELLELLDFGSRVAEEERDNLAKYFLETEEWRRVLRGEVDIIKGAKGSGKSALYSHLISKSSDFIKKDTLLIEAENPKGNPAFKFISQNNEITEEHFRFAWQLYFLAICIIRIKEESGLDERMLNIERILSESNLIPHSKTLSSIAQRAFNYVAGIFKKPEITTSINSSDISPQLTFSIRPGEPDPSDIERGFVSINSLFNELNISLKEKKINIWICIDRLDVAFADDLSVERIAIRALFRTYLDLVVFTEISFKIFIRDDIWRSITSGGFREASHITKDIEIRWSKNDLLNLIIKRVAANQGILTHYSISTSDLEINFETKERLFYKIFPTQVDAGSRKPKTFDWIVARIVDSNDVKTPRELVHLLASAKQNQIRLSEQGRANPSNGYLFSSQSIRDALLEVSKTKLEQTLYAEYHNEKPYIEKLRKKKAEQNLESLCLVWNEDKDKAGLIIERLTTVGFFRKYAEKDGSIWFIIPLLYRPALSIIQGKAR